MNSTSTANRTRAVWETLTIVVFLGLLWLPTLDHFLKLDRAKALAENRLPAKWPLFKGVEASRDFIAGVESYFNDHFGFRRRLIRWNHRWKDQLFHDALRQEVLVGQNGWLFYSGGQMVENAMRQTAWSEPQLEDWRRLLESRRDWLRERGIKYLFVVPPDKHTVYPEYLPAWIEPGSKPTKVRQLVDYMKAHSTVEMLDLSQTLIDAKKTRVDYLRTDTHWNLFGGFMAYRAVAQALSRQLPGLEPIPAEAYDWKPVTGASGDLVAMMDGGGYYPETEGVMPVPVKPRPTFDQQYDPVRLPHQGSPEFRPCFTLNEKGGGKALLFRDSFARSWFSFLGQHFKEVIYVWHYDWDCPLIEREKPDVVIDEMLERFFNLQDPKELARKDQLSAASVAQAAR